MKTVRLSCEKKMVLEPEFEIPLFYNEITSVRLVSVTERLKSRSRPSSSRCSFILCLRAEFIFLCFGSWCRVQGGSGFLSRLGIFVDVTFSSYVYRRMQRRIAAAFLFHISRFI